MATRGPKASAQSRKTKSPIAPNLRPGFSTNPPNEQEQGKNKERQGDRHGNTVQREDVRDVNGYTGESCSVLPRLSDVRECDISVVYVSV